jgi:hypothetical protein
MHANNATCGHDGNALLDQGRNRIPENVMRDINQQTEGVDVMSSIDVKRNELDHLDVSVEFLLV